MRSRFIALAMLLTLSACVYAAADNVGYYYGTPAPPAPTPSFGTYINFDTPTGTPDATGNIPLAANDFSSLGVSITSLDSNTLYYTSGSSMSQPYFISESANGYAVNANFAFSTPVAQVGLGLAVPGNTTVSLFDGTNLLYQVSKIGISSGLNTNSYVVFADYSGANITSMQVSSPVNAFDDLQYSVKAPEPSVPALLGIGLGVVGFIRRKFAR